MSKKILVALDDSPTNRLVFEAAISLAKQEDAELLLVHVLSTDERDDSPLTRLIPYSRTTTRHNLVERYQQQRQQAEQQRLATLKKFAEEARAEGIWVEFRQSIGNPRDLICYLARTWEADLIVMGRRKHSWLSEWWLGSISKFVSRHAPCPVHVVQLPSGTNSSPSQQNHWQTA